MNVSVQEPPSKESHVLPNTGFSEPLNPNRNTTLSHPDADTSTDATIEAPDIALSRTNSRWSFLGRHHTKNGKEDITTGMYNNIKYTDGTKEGKGVKEIMKETEGRHYVVDPPDEVVENEGDEQGYKIGERRKGVLRKLNLHKV